MENFGDAASISGSAPPSLHQKGLVAGARAPRQKLKLKLNFIRDAIVFKLFRNRVLDKLICSTNWNRAYTRSDLKYIKFNLLYYIIKVTSQSHGLSGTTPLAVRLVLLTKVYHPIPFHSDPGLMRLLHTSSPNPKPWTLKPWFVPNPTKP